MHDIERQVWREARAMTRREVITKAIVGQPELGAGGRDSADQYPACATATAQARTLGGHVGGDGPTRRAAAAQAH
jgi:hypothetical protein